MDSLPQSQQRVISKDIENFKEDNYDVSNMTVNYTLAGAEVDITLSNTIVSTSPRRITSVKYLITSTELIEGYLKDYTNKSLY